MMSTLKDTEIFQEEKENLDTVLKQVDKIIEEEESLLGQIRQEIIEFGRVCDEDDRLNKVSLFEKRGRKTKKVEELYEKRESPYFGRIDVDEKESDRILPTYFIGESGISDNGNVIVIDWRSPFSDIYYNKRALEFNINGIRYDLLLRRTLQIKNAQLLHIQTEYDCNEIGLKGELIDPFLLSVLEEKRKQRKLTNIIRTINSKQNDIIRKERYENFIVQGCAGSGKTMILLHRLSHMAFNYPSFKFETVYILTPNEGFNLHISELSRNLEIDKVNKCTVEEFYLMLIERLGQVEGRDKNRKKFEEVLSEKTVNEELLKEVYSIAFCDEIKEWYRGRWKQIIVEIDESFLEDIFKAYDVVTYNLQVFSYQTYSKLYNNILSVFMQSERAKKHLKETEEVREELERNVDEIRKATLINECDFMLAKEKVCKLIDKKIGICLGEENYLKEQIAYVQEEIGKQQQEISSLREEKRICAMVKPEDIWEKLQKNDISSMMYTVRKRNLALIQKIEIALQSIREMPPFAFFKRVKSKKVLRESMIDLKQKVMIEIEKYIAIAEKENHDEIVRLEGKMKKYSVFFNERKKNEEVIYQCKEKIQRESFLELQKEEMDLVFEEDGHVVDEYRESLSRYIEKKNVLKDKESELELKCEEISAIKKNVLSEADLERLSAIQTTVKEQMSIEGLSWSLEKLLKEVYAKYNQRYRSNAYRHQLFLKLYLFHMYYGKHDYNYYINIDEAQDLSISEYVLLKDILNNKTVFNLYGDVNQQIFEYRGISSWRYVKDILSAEVYTINENYRNTIQITEYCNDAFGMNMFPIGLEGRKVRKENYDDVFEKLRNISNENNSVRIAIIYSNRIKVPHEVIGLPTERLAMGYVDNRKISFVSVEMAKGLEFDIVAVITDKMTDAEKYIAYTRALEELFVIEGYF